MAHILPGFLPIIVALFLIAKDQSFSISAETLTICAFGSIALGISIDICRRKIENVFIKWINLTWIKVLFGKIYSLLLRRKNNIWSLRTLFNRYDNKQKEALKLWLKIKLAKNPDILKEIGSNGLLKKEFLDPTITSGDWWALLNIREKVGLSFYMQEYFVFYEFSFNFMIALIISELIMMYFVVYGNLSSGTYYQISGLGFILILIFHESTVHWLLSTKRFLRKLLLYSLLDK